MIRATLAFLLLVGFAAGQDPRYYLWQEEVELQLLLRSCTQQLGVPIDFDKSAVKGRISVEAPDGLTFAGLWALTNRRLADEGLACVQLPGQDALTVVALDQASGLARIEYGDLAEVKAGYVKALYYIEHADPRELEASLRALLPKEGTVVATLSTRDHMLISGLTAQVSEAMTALGFLDSGPEPVKIEEFEPKHVSALALAAQLQQVTQARAAAGAEKLRGAALASAARGTLLLVAPQAEQALWHGWIERFDRPDAVLTRNYVPTRFGLAETAKLIEEVIGSKPLGWRLVQDELTGSLLITAPFGAHAEIEALLERLEATDLGLSRDLRSYSVSHRDVEELLDLLAGLMDKGGSIPNPEGGPVPPRSVDPAEGLTLTADKSTNRILAYGEVHLLGQLEQLIEVLDVEHPQVLVEVLVVSLSESEMVDLGVELRYSGEIGGTAAEVASLFGLGSPALSSGAIPSPTGSGATGVVLDPGRFSAVVRALEAVNQGRSMTIPKVLVANHQDAQLNSVLQTPFLSTAASNTVATTSLGGTSDAGTSIRVTPHILDGDRLRLEYSVSISSFVGDSADPALPPPRQENLLDSTVVVPDGHTVVVGGVDIETESEATSRVPLLGQIPILGRLFRSNSKSKTRTRFYVFLRCNILTSGFEQLRYVSQGARTEAGVPNGYPVMRPRIIR
jgi:general secretion pathway protein D